MSIEDAELIHRWQAGEADAFENLVRRWQMPITRFLGRFVWQRDQVHDLSQEVFFRVFCAKNTYRENGAFATWIYRIALNVARDHARQRKPVETLPIETLVSGEDDIPDSYATRETVAFVIRALADLPQAHREVLVLRHYEEMSFEAMSRMLQVPASTLKSRFSAALLQLRARLRELGVTGKVAE